MTRWPRNIRTTPAEELLLGQPSITADGWYRERKYLGGKRERVARIALARELRRGSGDFSRHFTLVLAAMIDRRNDSQIIKQKVGFVPPDKRTKLKAPGLRDIEVAAFLHARSERDTGRGNIARAIAEAVDHFGFEERTIREIWKVHKPK